MIIYFLTAIWHSVGQFCKLEGRSAANPPTVVAAIARRDRQTDARPFHRSCSACYACSANNKLIKHMQHVNSSRCTPRRILFDIIEGSRPVVVGAIDVAVLLCKQTLSTGAGLANYRHNDISRTLPPGHLTSPTSVPRN